MQPTHPHIWNHDTIFIPNTVFLIVNNLHCYTFFVQILEVSLQVLNQMLQFFPQERIAVVAQSVGLSHPELLHHVCPKPEKCNIL